MEFKRYNKTIDVVVDVVITVSEDDGDADRERIKSGELFLGTITVEAKAFGLTGSDSLSACELKPNNMFNSEPYNTSVAGYVTEYSMEENAIADLVKQLESAMATLGRIYGRN